MSEADSCTQENEDNEEMDEMPEPPAEEPVENEEKDPTEEEPVDPETLDHTIRDSSLPIGQKVALSNQMTTWD